MKKNNISKLRPFAMSGHYKYFHKYSKMFSICLIDKCGAVIKTKGSSPTGLKRHLDNKHAIKPKVQEPETKKARIDNFMEFNPIPNGMDRDIATLVCKDLISVNRLANSSTIRKWARKFYGVELPSSRATLWKIVENIAIKARNNITSEIVRQKSMPSLTADEWTSPNGRRFLNINVHFSEQQFCLGLARIDKAANAEFLSSLMKSKLGEVSAKSAVITTDGAAVMGTLCKKMNLVQQKCILHGINLAIVACLYREEIDLFSDIENFSEEEQDSDFEVQEIPDIEENVTTPDDPELKTKFKSIIEKVRTMNKSFRYGKKKDELQEIFARKSSGELNLHLDVATRWNSMLPMISSFLKGWDALRRYHAEKDLDFGFTLDEKNALSKLQNILSSVQKMILAISKESANLMTADIAVTQCITELQESLGTIENPWCNNIKSRYLERRTILSDVMWSLSNMNNFGITNIFYTEPTKSQIKDTYKLFKNNQAETNLPETDPMIIAQNPEKYQPDFIDHEYLLACLKNIRPSSISSERAFSVCSRILIPIRGKLSNKNLDIILFLNKNL